MIHELSSLDKTPLEGAQFKLTYANGEVVDAADGKLSSNGLYTSNSEGQIVISNVTGTIICTEVSSALATPSTPIPVPRRWSLTRR